MHYWTCFQKGIRRGSLTHNSSKPDIYKPIDRLYSKGLAFAHLNANGLLHKNRIDQLRIHLTIKPIDILAISETKTDPGIDDSDIDINGYKVYRADRLSDGGGGVAIYVRIDPNIVYKPRPDLQDNDLECLVGEIFLPKSKPILFGAFYRPPSSPVSWQHKLETMTDTITLENKETLFTGDFNVDLLKNEKNLQYLTEVYQFDQVISEATRVTDKTSTLIDHIYTTNREYGREYGVIPLGVSDHHMVYFIRKHKQPRTSHKHTEITFRSYKHFNEEAFQRDLDQVPWSVLDMDEDPNDAWSSWSTLYTEVLDRHAPLRTRRIKVDSAPWINDDILTAMQVRDEIHQQALRFKTESLWLKYRDSRNNLVSLIRQAKTDYYKNIIEQNVSDSKTLWKSLRLVLPSKIKTAAQSFLINGVLQTNPKAIAEAFNNFFVKIGESLAEAFSNDGAEFTFDDRYTNGKYTIPTIDPAFVLKELQHMKPTKATGLDGITARSLRAGAPVIYQSLTTVMNISIQSGIFINDWKCAKVIPLFKSGDQSDVSNYRPISILSVPSKILERHVHTSFYNYLESNNLITPDQSGFRPKHSCETALLKMTDDWFNGIDKGNMTGVIYIDLKKAFDTVNHDILLKKLTGYGVDTKSWDWFKSYLSNRSQLVLWSGEMSERQSVTVGVPQGSILGPLLFSLYINDLPDSVDSSVNMFADDSTIAVTGKTVAHIQNKLTNDFKQVAQWMSRNKLTLHVGKTKVQLIGTYIKVTKNTKIEVMYEGQQLEQVYTVKHLGVYIDSNLTWHDHYDAICKKISQKIGVMIRIRPYTDVEILKKVFNAIVLPHMEYACVVWGRCSNVQNNVGRICKLQKRAARVILNCRIRDISSVDLYAKMKWMPFDDRISYKRSLMMYKVVHKITPAYLHNFLPASNIHDYRTRFSKKGNVRPEKAKLKYFTRSFRHEGCLLWNELDSSLKQAESVAQFKSRYMSQYFNH